MPRIPKPPTVQKFVETWSADFKEAVKKAAGPDGKLTSAEAKKLARSPLDERMFADTAVNYFKTTGKKSVSVEVIAEEMKAYAQRAATAAAGADGTLSLEDGKKLPTDLKEDFFVLRGNATVAPLDVPASASMKAARTALLAATKDLLMPSETDAKFGFLTGKQLNGAPITEGVLRQQLSGQHDAVLPHLMPGSGKLSTKRQVEVRDASAFFQHIIDGADPADPASMANATRFAALKQTIDAHLTDVKVYRFGTISISTMIVGRTKDGELAALLTGQVET
jgi:hypothetical protein